MTRAVPAALVAESNLFDFFFEHVQQAVRHQRAPVSESTVLYLSNLLAEQGKRDEADDGVTLVELRQRAVSAPPAEAVEGWRRLGDRSLVLAGYFHEHLRRRRLSTDYVARMGESAYRALEALLSNRGGFAEIYSELGARFERCVEVVAEVREETRERTDTDIVRLYEDWLTTGSPKVAEQLRRLGVVPVRVTGTG